MSTAKDVLSVEISMIEAQAQFKQSRLGSASALREFQSFLVFSLTLNNSLRIFISRPRPWNMAMGALFSEVSWNSFANLVALYNDETRNLSWSTEYLVCFFATSRLNGTATQTPVLPVSVTYQYSTSCTRRICSVYIPTPRPDGFSSCPCSGPVSIILFSLHTAHVSTRGCGDDVFESPEWYCDPKAFARLEIRSLQHRQLRSWHHGLVSSLPDSAWISPLVLNQVYLRVVRISLPLLDRIYPP